jgi:hypothetical protein
MIWIWISLLLLGHAGAAAAPLTLSATAMHSGEEATFTIDRAGDALDEGQSVWIMVGPSEGEGPCPAYLEGGCWGITSPRFVQMTWADPEGVASWLVEVDASIALGVSRTFQAAVEGPEGPRLSNAVTVTVEAPPEEGSACDLPPSDCTLEDSYSSDFFLVAPSPGGCALRNVAFDGTHYYGLTTNRVDCPIMRFAPDGRFEGGFEVGMVGASVFTKRGCGGPTYLNGIDSREVWVQTAPGLYAPHTTLDGGILDRNIALTFDHERALFVAPHGYGSRTINRWNPDGSFVDTVELADGLMGGYAMAVSDSGCYLTQTENKLHSYDGDTGELVDTAMLEGAPFSAEAFSYVNGRVFVQHLGALGDGWLGFSVGL